jgi:hypothetical protein
LKTAAAVGHVPFSGHEPQEGPPADATLSPKESLRSCLRSRGTPTSSGGAATSKKVRFAEAPQEWLLEKGHRQKQASQNYEVPRKEALKAASRINSLVGYLQYWNQHEIKHASQFATLKSIPIDAPLSMPLEKKEAADAIELYKIFQEEQKVHEIYPTQPTAAQFFGSSATDEIEEARKLIRDLYSVRKIPNQGSAAVQLLRARAERPSPTSLKERAKRLIKQSHLEQEQAREHEQFKTLVEKDVMSLVDGLNISHKEAVAKLNRVFVKGPRGVYLSDDDKKMFAQALKNFIQKE